MNLQEIILIIASCIVLFGLWTWFQHMKEMNMLKSSEYKQAVEEWDVFQEQYKNHKHKSFKPFPLLIDTGGWIAVEITVRQDKEGRIVLRKEELSAKEFIVASKRIRKLLAS